MFLYNSTYKIVICSECKSAIIPGLKSLEWHLRSKPHRLVGDTFTATLKLLNSYDLRAIEELRINKPSSEDNCESIEHLESYDGFYCLQQSCSYGTIVEKKMKEHVWAAHKAKAKNHKAVQLWKECKLQTYFTARRLVDYFVVVETGAREHIFTGGSGLALLTEGEKACFEKIEADYWKVKVEIAIQAGIVHEFEDSRSSREPWLDRTGFPSHLVGLLDEEIHSSFCLPPRKELERACNSLDPILVRIINGTRSLLQDAYQLCSDNSPNCKMTYQRATILNEFYLGASGKSAAFRARKLESTLVDYFQTWTELVPTSQQQITMQEVVSAAKAYQEEEDNEEKQAALQRAL
ncbi:hypothetical protein V500_04036 [Pseudogymnoascus sp. VKM F-4518 (FW-2643)]|nr:hypothetical protein V500_04036 [Pseudogymnoascus sp. VKM F-4518 (FW-2643)]